MPNSSCATSDDVIRLQTVNFRVSSTCALTSVFATFLVSVKAIHLIHTKSIFQSSTRIILLFNILYANLHQICYGIQLVLLLHKGIFMVEVPCDWLESEVNCVPYSNIVFTGIGGMIYAQTGLLVERAIATFHKNYTKTVSRVTGLFVSTVVFLFSIFTFRLIIWDDPLDGYLLSCFSPPSHSSRRVNWFLYACLFLTFFNLATSMSVMYYNKRLEYETRYIVKERFKKQEAISSTHTICIISMSQFLMMFIYSLGALVLRNLRAQIPAATFSSMIIWIYTLPYIALLLPLLLIFRIRATKASRNQRIQDITTRKQTQEEYINNMNRM